MGQHHLISLFLGLLLVPTLIESYKLEQGTNQVIEDEGFDLKNLDSSVSDNHHVKRQIKSFQCDHKDKKNCPAGLPLCCFKNEVCIMYSTSVGACYIPKVCKQDENSCGGVSCCTKTELCIENLYCGTQALQEAVNKRDREKQAAIQNAQSQNAMSKGQICNVGGVGGK